ncbi:MAG: hypothetical protein IJH86_07595 [Clostridia bacterium]|nr:hypothetical protein [Clostridia bacterium]
MYWHVLGECPICTNVTKGYKRKADGKAGQLRFREMIRKGLVSETLLDNIIRAAAIFREEGSCITVVQINDRYASLLGIDNEARFMEHLDEASRQKFRELLDKANMHALGGSEGIIHYIRKDGSAIALNMRVFLLYTLDNHRLYLVTQN